MRFPEKKDAITHLEKLGGDLCQFKDTGSEYIIYTPKIESAYAYARQEVDKLEYEEGFRITDEGTHFETWSKSRTGQWVKAIM